MTSATGNSPRTRRAGFSLIEILLVLGLMAIAGGIVIYNFAGFADRGDEMSTDETIAAAIRKARFLAASDRATAALFYDKEQGELVVYGDRSEEVTFPLNEDFGPRGSAEINFYFVPPSEGLSPASDPLRTQVEAKEVRFSPDRSATPFVIEIDYGTGSPERHAYDPFSSLRRAKKE